MQWAGPGKGAPQVPPTPVLPGTALGLQAGRAVGRAGQGRASGAPHPRPPRDSSGPPGCSGKQTPPPGAGQHPGALGWGAALPSGHPSCRQQAPARPGHSPTLMAQPRSTASLPAFGNKHRLRQAGAEPSTRSCADSRPP